MRQCRDREGAAAAAIALAVKQRRGCRASQPRPDRPQARPEVIEVEHTKPPRQLSRSIITEEATPVLDKLGSECRAQQPKRIAPGLAGNSVRLGSLSEAAQIKRLRPTGCKNKV